MKARAKSSDTPHPIWGYGEYTTTPPNRPNGETRPEGNYIDEGGFPSGVKVYTVNMDTLCRQTVAVDHQKREIYEEDILLLETKEEIGYLIVQDIETAVDIIHGEIIGLEKLKPEEIRVIGNTIDFPAFIDNIRHHAEHGLNVPYIPALNVMGTSLPFLKMTCLKCGHTTLACSFIARHKECGGYFTADFATKVYRKREKEKAFA